MDFSSGLYEFSSFESCWISFLQFLNSINFEMSPSQKCFPLESAQLVRPPLVCPNPFQVEGIVTPPCSCPSSWADHLQPAQQELGLSPDSYHGQGPPQEGGGYCQLSLLCPHLPPPSLLGASHPHPRDGKVFGGGLYQFWQWQRVAGRRCPCPAVSNICIFFEPL